MARIRSVKPDFWDDRKLAKATSRDARLLYIGLWNFADEHGRCNGDPEWLRGHLFAYDEDVTTDDVDEWLDELAAFGRLTRYVVGDDPFLFLPKLAVHQRLEPEKAASKIPAPEEANDLSPQVRANLPGETARDSDLPGETARRAGSSETSVASLCSREHVIGAGKPPPRKSARPADEVWDALLAACEVDSQVPDSARGAYNRATKDLRAVGADPTEIHRRAAFFRARWPDVSLTPTALARRWAECAVAPPIRQTRASPSAAALREYADQLRGEESA